MQDTSQAAHCARDTAAQLAGVYNEAAAAWQAACTWCLTLNPAIECCSQGLLGPEGSCALQLVPSQLPTDGEVLPGREGQCQAPPSPEHQSVALALLVGRIAPVEACRQACGPA